MARAHSSTVSDGYMKVNSKKTKCMDLVVKSNRTEHTTSANGMTIIDKEEAVSISLTELSMRANGEITKSMVWER